MHKQLPLEAAQQGYAQVREFVQTTPLYDLETIQNRVTEIGEVVTTTGKAGAFLGKLRLAVTGQQVSPPVFESMVALGRERATARLDEELQILKTAV
ncbi:hypothetical protein [Candidatus Amarobacter glycogenicus]|uniref:hypothetical protein n=1 Tax=Candidatus Amarobacter glycogenicus TaxID=3140699 RepID=UPI002A0CC734|nr:hypothetical protein [Dehalococcoidia bacterium]